MEPSIETLDECNSLQLCGNCGKPHAKHIDALRNYTCYRFRVWGAAATECDKCCSEPPVYKSTNELRIEIADLKDRLSKYEKVDR